MEEITNKKERFGLRLTQEEKMMLRSLAVRSGLSQTEFIKKKIFEEEPEILNELLNIISKRDIEIESVIDNLEIKFDSLENRIIELLQMNFVNNNLIAATLLNLIKDMNKVKEYQNDAKELAEKIYVK